MVYFLRKKNAFKFCCEKCDFYSNNKTDYQRHLQTKKHNGKNGKKKTHLHKCRCGKSYKYQTGLSRHKKLCTFNSSENEILLSGSDEDCVGSMNEEKTMTLDIEENETEETIKKEPSTMEAMFIELMKQNKELQNKLIEIAKQPKTIVNNNSFNLNNFLNIQCKDAMNLSEFLEDIQITVNDLKYLSNHGFVEAFKNTFVKQLEDLDQTLRPIHCTDQKRKSMIVKNNDTWEKDDDYDTLHKAIKSINNKQITAYNKYNKRRDPEYLDSDQNLVENSHMIMNMCSYNGENVDKYNRKLVQEIASTTKIKK